MTRRGRAFTLALIGPDGSGKSTVAKRVAAELTARGTAAEYLYMGVSTDSSNRALPTTRLAARVKRARGAAPDRAGPRRHETAMHRRRGAATEARAAVRLGNRLAEEWYRQLLAWLALRRGRVVVFDRHWFADYHAYDIAGRDRTWDRRVHGFVLRRLYPKPDVTVYLDAPAEVLFARKGEGSVELLERRRRDYLALSEVLPHFAVVDCRPPVDDVVAAALAAAERHTARP